MIFTNNTKQNIASSSSTIRFSIFRYTFLVTGPKNEMGRLRKLIGPWGIK